MPLIVTILLGAGVVAVIAIGAGLLLHKIISMYIDGGIGGVECALIAGLYFGLIVTIITLPTSSGKGVVLFFILLLFASIPILNKRLEKRADHVFYDDRISHFREAIERDPRNLAAREQLVNDLHRTGRLDEAIQELTELARLSPAVREYSYRLRQYIEERDEKQLPPVRCPACGHTNPPHRVRCIECEGQLSVSGNIKEWLVGGGMKQIAITWAITMAVVTVVLLAFSMLSVLGKILVVALILLIAIMSQLLHAYRNT